MVNKIDQSYLSQLSINPKFALKIYASILTHGVQACTDTETFVESVKMVTQVFLRFDDYIHSNNLLQIAKSEWSEIENLSWYQYAQLQILTKRIPKFALLNPAYFIRKVQYLCTFESMKSQIEAFLVMTLSSIIDYLPYFESTFRLQVRTFTEALIKQNESWSALIQGKLQELKEKALPRVLVSSQKPEPIETESFLESNPLKLKDSKVHILIIGDLAMKKHDVQGIAKEYGVSHTQLEFLEYQDAKQYNMSQLQYSSKYAGIIVGPIPHKVGDLGDHSSLVELLKEPGYPHAFIAMQGGELKLSKQLLKKGFADIVAHFNSQ